MEKRVRDLTDEDYDRMCKKYKAKENSEDYRCDSCPLNHYCPCTWEDELDDIVELDD